MKRWWILTDRVHYDDLLRFDDLECPMHVVTDDLFIALIFPIRFSQNTYTDHLSSCSIDYRLVRSTTLDITFDKVMYVRMTLASPSCPELHLGATTG